MLVLIPVKIRRNRKKTRTEYVDALEIRKKVLRVNKFLQQTPKVYSEKTPTIIDSVNFFLYLVSASAEMNT